MPRHLPLWTLPHAISNECSPCKWLHGHGSKGRACCTSFQACSHFCLHLSQATVGLRKASTAGKNSSVGSARQPSLTQSKEVDLAAISYVRSAPPTIPLVWARSAVTAKVSFRFCSVKSSALASNATLGEMSERFDHWNWVGGSARIDGCTAKLPTTHSGQLKLGSLSQEMPMIDWSLANLPFGCR